MTRARQLVASEGPAPHRCPSLPNTQRLALERAVARWSAQFGEASTAWLRATAEHAFTELGDAAQRLDAALDDRLSSSDGELPAPAARRRWASLSADGLCTQVERDHVARFGTAALQAERADDLARERARNSGPALARYQQMWDRALARLQRAHPGRWRVPGLSDEEVRDALTLRLMELIVAPPADAPRGRPGKAWGLCVAQSQLTVLRRSFRLHATPTDFDAAPLLERAPSQEERWLTLEADQRRALAAERARGQLSQSQRSWLAAMLHSATNGEFFASSDQLNLSAAARELGKNRSSAQRGYRALQECFQRERGRLE